MPELLIQLIIVMLICGFVYWCYLKISPLMPVAEPFKGIIDVLVLIIVGAIVLFYVIVPLLRMLAHVNLGLH